MAKKNPRHSRTFSATNQEVERLDAWAHHHNMSRSEAIRSLIMAIKIDGQTALSDFSDVEPHPEAVEAVELASRRPVSEHSAPKGHGIVAKATGRVCFERPSDLLGGRCIGAKNPEDLSPDSPACPICWDENMTAGATRKEARHALARQRADEAQELLKEENTWEGSN